MSRKKPNVLVESVDYNTGKATQVLEAEVIYVVVYHNKPFNLKLVNTMFDYPGPKYKKTTFASEAHARNLAKKLNEMYHCNDFTVVEFQG